jgi:hypothetical protein
LAALLAVGTATPAACKPGWQTIFDGRTLDGWTPKITGQRLGDDPWRTFAAENGAIRVSYDRYEKFGGRFGHLAYKRPVGPFRLRFDYRFTGDYLPDVEPWQHSNSGAMLLAQAPATMTIDQKFPVSIELQLLGADGADPRPTGNLCTPGTDVRIAGRTVAVHCTPSSSPTIENGRWTHVEVEVGRDGRITHFIDGEEVLAYDSPQLDPKDKDARPLVAAAGGRLALRRGYIYLQSEGHPVEFRKIALMELE